MHHVTVRVNNDDNDNNTTTTTNNNNNNNNNYAPVYKEACKLTNFSIQCCHVTWQKNERLKPEDSGDELINSLSGSDCIG